MQRVIWGSVLLGLSLLTALSAGFNENGPAASYASAALLAAGGGLLLWSGVQYLGERTRVGEIALRYLREGGSIPGDALSDGAGLSEYRARRLLHDLKKKGAIPIQAEVI